MKKYYQHPSIRVVEIDERDIVCQSPYKVASEIEVGEYNTFGSEPSSSTSGVWPDPGTGSDF